MNLTVSLADLPGAIRGVFLPLILKSCATLPLLTTVKITVPSGTFDFESLNLNSVIVTVTFVVGATAALAELPDEEKMAAAPTPATASTAITNTCTNRRTASLLDGTREQGRQN